MKMNLQFFGGRGAGASSSGGGGNAGAWNNSNHVRSFLQNEANKFGTGISKEQLAEKVYQAARADGADVAILNGKYLTITNANGTAEFSFTKHKSEGTWEVTPMLSWNEVTTGRHNGQTMYRAAGQWFSNKKNAEWAAVSAKLD